jgi:hypothetical protein
MVRSQSVVVEPSLLIAQQAVLIPRGLLQLSARPAIESFLDPHLRVLLSQSNNHVLCSDSTSLLDFSHLGDCIRFLLDELTDSALLILSLFTWEVNRLAYSHTYWTLTPMPLTLLERFWLTRSLLSDRSWDMFYTRYRVLVVRPMEKQDFIHTVRGLRTCLDALLLNS